MVSVIRRRLVYDKVRDFVAYVYLSRSCVKLLSGNRNNFRYLSMENSSFLGNVSDSRRKEARGIVNADENGDGKVGKLVCSR